VRRCRGYDEKHLRSFAEKFFQKIFNAKKRLFRVNSRFSLINIGIIEKRRDCSRRPNRYYYSTLSGKGVSKIFGFFIGYFVHRQPPLASAILKPEGNHRNK
jgi:hypothetical protein